MSFLESLASLLFPPRCAFCGKPGVHGVCSECEKALPYCKTPLHERAEIGACLAPLKYEGIVREALLNYKFHAGQSRCTGFGDVLAQAAAEHFGGEFDIVTYVPVSKKRKQERGYDQSYLWRARPAATGASHPKRCCKRRRTTSRSRRFRPVRSGRKTSSAHTLPSMRTRSRVSAFCSSTISSPPAPRSAKPREFYGKLARKKSSAPPSPRRTKTEVFKKEATRGPVCPYFPLRPCGKSRTMLLQTQFRAVIIKTSWESMSIAHFSFQKNKR